MSICQARSRISTPSRKIDFVFKSSLVRFNLLNTTFKKLPISCARRTGHGYQSSMTKMQNLLDAIDAIVDDLVDAEMSRAGFINAEDLARRLLNRLSPEQRRALMDDALLQRIAEIAQTPRHKVRAA
jgi:hypothetical protein